MTIESLRRTIERHRDKIARLQQNKSREANAAVAENNRASVAFEAAARTSSVSTARSKLRTAKRHEAAAARHYQKVADIEKKIAAEQRQLNSAERRLASAIAAGARKMEQERAKAQRDHERRMSDISNTLNRHDELHRVALSAISRLQQVPQEITVLFLAANPQDQHQLRLDEEVRAIGEMLRKSEHRDAVRLESRWAVRPLDVLQAINECKPAVIHVSGHGSEQEEIAFVDEAGTTKFVTKDAFAQTLAAASGEIQLVFFNLCYSRGQAEAVVKHVPAAIGMNAAIGDEAARVFAAAFYSAIGFGLSIDKAFAQAKAALMLEGIREDMTPELFLTPGLDEDVLVLVRPELSAAQIL